MSHRKILFIATDKLGDCIIVAGLLDTLLHQDPDCRATVICGAMPAPLFTTIPQVERVLILYSKGSTRFPFRKYFHRFLIWLRCIPTRWDRIINLYHPRRYTRFFHRRYDLHPIFHDISRRALKDEEFYPITDRLRRYFDLTDSTLIPTLYTAPGDEDRAKKLIPKQAIILGITAAWIGKRWPYRNFQELIQRLTAKDGMLAHHPIVIFAAAAERPLIQEFLRGVDPRHVQALIGLPLLLVYACMQRCRLFIGNDSGLMHMAAAARIPTLGLYGPSSEKLYPPLGNNTLAIRTTMPPVQLWDTIDDATARRLMDNLSVDDVLAGVRRLLQQSPLPPSEPPSMSTSP